MGGALCSGQIMLNYIINEYTHSNSKTKHTILYNKIVIICGRIRTRVKATNGFPPTACSESLDQFTCTSIR